MANYNDTILKTDNPAIFKTVIDRFEKMKGENDGFHYKNHQLLWLLAGKKSNGICNYHNLPQDVQNAYLNELTCVVIKSRNDNFHDEAVELSKQFPGEKIICEYTYESDWHFTETTVEYLDGKDTFVSESYNPRLMTDYKLPDLIGDESRAVLKKIHDFVMGLYDNKMIREGETVKFEFISDNHKFLVTVPFGPYYELTIYNGQEKTKTEWTEVNPNWRNELPF